MNSSLASDAKMGDKEKFLNMYGRCCQNHVFVMNLPAPIRSEMYGIETKLYSLFSLSVKFRVNFLFMFFIKIIYKS